MRTKLSSIGLAAMIAATLVVFIGCGEGTSPVEPPPPVEVVTAVIVSPTSGQVISSGPTVLSATARSSKIGDITDPSKYLWTIDGSQVGNGMALSTNLTPGSHQVCVSVQGSSGASGNTCVPLSVVHAQLVGKVVVTDLLQGEVVPVGVRIKLFVSGADTISTNVAPDGSFSANVFGFLNKDSISFIVDAVNTSSRIYHPMRGTFAKALVEKPVIFIMTPLAVTIPNGVYAGRVVDMRLSRAYVAGGDALGFFDRRPYDVGGIPMYRVKSHKVLPVPLVIRNDLGDTPITASDSVAMWGFVTTLEDHIGLDLFRPAMKSEENDTLGIDVYMLSNLAKPAFGGSDGILYPTPGSTSLGRGRATFRGRDVLLNNGGGVFRHELIHVLGFDHGCGFQSIQNTECSGVSIDYTGFVSGIPSPFDVAYARLMYVTAALEDKYSTHFSIMESHQGERELMLGLPREIVRR
ncbi:MAG: hypothetical protein AB200_00575 [Parcubacteria bacterium C7867-005]|nr:MAG: hypothetical protein AB200_00575 [Parcubacteria bacterium C7867-005]